jgi:hypothetical protein
MIACYCRVSSRRQKTDRQKAEITPWLPSHGVELAAVQWFEDIETGMTMRRSALSRCSVPSLTGLSTPSWSGSWTGSLVDSTKGSRC